MFDTPVRGAGTAYFLCNLADSDAYCVESLQDKETQMNISRTRISALTAALALAAFAGPAIAHAPPKAKPPAADTDVETAKDKASDKPAVPAKAKVPTDTNYTGHKLEKQATIKLNKAREIALKEHPGTITDFELEREKGGSGLRYSFDIKSNNVGYEVGVDAMSGKVLENSKDGPHPD